jgi:hypothetical protein
MLVQEENRDFDLDEFRQKSEMAVNRKKKSAFQKRQMYNNFG